MSTALIPAKHALLVLALRLLLVDSALIHIQFPGIQRHLAFDQNSNSGVSAVHAVSALSNVTPKHGAGLTKTAISRKYSTEMPPKGSTRKTSKKQVSITQHALPLLKKPMEQIGKQVNVPGSFWDGKQYFSRAGLLSDPNMDAYYLGILVMVGTNKSRCLSRPSPIL